MNTSAFEKYESNVRSYCRHFPTVFSEANNSIITDEEGREYIDFFCGAGAVNYGHNNPYIKGRLLDYLKSDGIIHALDMYTAPKREFIEDFEGKILHPRGLDYKIQFCGPTGTNSIEAALKLARKVKKRNNVFAFMGCFHGMSLGALSMTSEKYARDGAGVTLGNVTHIPAPYMVDNINVIDYMQLLLDDDHSGVDKPAAIVLETLQAEGGIYPFDNSFLKDIRSFCDKNDILMIVDDIQVGCCRTGSFFSFERAGVIPDMVVMSKSIGGIGMPLSILLLKKEYDIWLPAEHNGTFRGNQLSFVAGTASFEWLIENNIEKETIRKGEILSNYIKKEILTIDNRIQLRGMGLIWGLDFGIISSDVAEKVVEKCFDNRLICECAGRNGSVVKIMPPLTIEDELILMGLEILKRVIADVLSYCY